MRFRTSRVSADAGQLIELRHKLKWLWMRIGHDLVGKVVG